MSRFFLTLFKFLFLIFPFFLMAQENEKQLWQEAQTFYQNQDYLSALSIYEELLNNTPSTYLHYNLANTHAQIFFQAATMTPSFHIAKAIWHYEKSLQLDHSNYKTKNNLTKIKNYLHLDEYRVAEDSTKVTKKTFVNQKNISNTGGFFLLTASLLFFLLFVIGRKKRMLQFLLFASLIIYGVLTVFLFQTKPKEKNPTYAIVSENNTRLYQDEETTDKYTLILPAGLKVQITKQIKNKALVHFEQKIFTHWQKFNGWIEVEKLLKY